MGSQWRSPKVWCSVKMLRAKLLIALVRMLSGTGQPRRCACRLVYTSATGPIRWSRMLLRQVILKPIKKNLLCIYKPTYLVSARSSFFLRCLDKYRRNRQESESENESERDIAVPTNDMHRRRNNKQKKRQTQSQAQRQTTEIWPEHGQLTRPKPTNR